MKKYLLFSFTILFVIGLTGMADNGYCGPTKFKPSIIMPTIPTNITPLSINYRQEQVATGSLSQTLSIPDTGRILTDGEAFNFNKVWNPWWSGEFGLKGGLDFITKTSKIDYDIDLPYTIQLNLPDKVRENTRVWLEPTIMWDFDRAYIKGVERNMEWSSTQSISINAPLDGLGWANIQNTFTPEKLSWAPDRFDGTAKVSGDVPTPIGNIPIWPEIPVPVSAPFRVPYISIELDLTAFGKGDIESSWRVTDTTANVSQGYSMFSTGVTKWGAWNANTDLISVAGYIVSEAGVANPYVAAAGAAILAMSSVLDLDLNFNMDITRIDSIIFEMLDAPYVDFGSVLYGSYETLNNHQFNTFIDYRVLPISEYFYSFSLSLVGAYGIDDYGGSKEFFNYQLVSLPVGTRVGEWVNGRLDLSFYDTVTVYDSSYYCMNLWAPELVLNQQFSSRLAPAGTTLITSDMLSFTEIEPAPVPEPGILILLGISMVSIAGLRIRWK